MIQILSYYYLRSNQHTFVSVIIIRARCRYENCADYLKRAIHRAQFRAFSFLTRGLRSLSASSWLPHSLFRFVVTVARVTICYPTLLQSLSLSAHGWFCFPIGSTFAFFGEIEIKPRVPRTDATNDGCTANRIGFMMADFEVSRNDQVHWLFGRCWWMD